MMALVVECRSPPVKAGTEDSGATASEVVVVVEVRLETMQMVPSRYCYNIALHAHAFIILTDYGSYGAGGSGGGGSSFRDEQRRGGFEEYNAGDDEVASTPTTAQSRTTSGRIPPTRKATAPPPIPTPAPVEDLLGGFGDDDAFGSSVTSTSNGLGGLAMNKDLPAVSKPSVAIDGWSIFMPNSNKTDYG
jgi:hypothetical protein